MAYISTSKITDTTITVYLEDLDEKYNANERTCKWYVKKQGASDSTYESRGSMTLPNKISNSAPYQFTSFQPDTWYTVKAIITAEGWTNPKEVVLTNDFKTTKSSTDPDPDKPVEPEPPPEEEDENKPKPFKWSERALAAFNNNKATTELTAEEWNSFMKELKKLNKKAFDYDAVESQRGNFITAKKFNLAAQGAKYIKTVYPGQKCEGKMFIEMVDAYNEFLKR